MGTAELQPVYDLQNLASFLPELSSDSTLATEGRVAPEKLASKIYIFSK